MGMAVFLPSWWFGLEQPNTGAYRLFGVVVTSWRPHANEYFWELLLPVSLSPWWTIAAPNFCKDPPALAGKVWFSLLWGHCSLPLGSNVHQILCVPSKSGLFPPILWKSCNQIPLAFKVRFSGNSFSCCQTLTLGSLTWGSESSLQWEKFCDIIDFQFVSSPPDDYVILFNHDCTPPTISLQLLLCLWIHGTSFSVGSSIFLSIMVQQFVVIPVLSQGVSAQPSTLPSWTNSRAIYQFVNQNIYKIIPRNGKSLN